MDVQFGIDELLHALTQIVHVVRGNLNLTSTLVQALDGNVIAVTDGDINEHLTVPQVVGSLAKHEEQRPRVGSESAGRMQVQEFYVLALVHPVVHTFYFIVHLGCYRPILHLQLAAFVHLLHGRPRRHFHYLLIVTAAYRYFLLFHSHLS